MKNYVLLAWSFLLMGTLSSVRGQVSAPVTNSANGHLYYYYSGFVAWNDAESTAVSMGGHLATIRSSQENQFINDKFGGNGEFWIGLNDRANEGTFQWVSGESSLYSNWEPGQPDDAGIGEDAVYMSGSAGGTWADTVESFIGFIAGAVIEVIPPPPNIVRSQFTTNATVNWVSTSNIQYQVQYSSYLSSNGWTNLGSLVSATTTNSSMTDASTNALMRFYRVMRIF